jgi:hypothetical protein
MNAYGRATASMYKYNMAHGSLNMVSTRLVLPFASATGPSIWLCGGRWARLGTHLFITGRLCLHCFPPRELWDF